MAAAQHQTFLAGVALSGVHETVHRLAQKKSTQMTVQVHEGETTLGSWGNFSGLETSGHRGVNIPIGIASRVPERNMPVPRVTAQRITPRSIHSSLSRCKFTNQV